MVELFSYQLSSLDLLSLLITGLVIGAAKAGISASNFIAVPLLVIVFGGRDSTGVMLPILITADLFAVYYYSRHADWFHLGRLFPWAAIGVLLGTLLGDRIDDDSFRQVMGIIIFSSLALMIWQETRKAKFQPPKGLWIAYHGGKTTGHTQ